MGYEQNILVEKKIIETKEGKLPKYFDLANLNNLFVDQFFTWDAVNRKVINGSDDNYAKTPYKDHIMKPPHEKMGSWTFQTGLIQEKKKLLKSVSTQMKSVYVWVFLS